MILDKSVSDFHVVKYRKMTFPFYFAMVSGISICIYFFIHALTVNQLSIGLAAMLTIFIIFYINIGFGLLYLTADLEIDKLGLRRKMFSRYMGRLCWHNIELIREYCFFSPLEKKPVRGLHLIKKSRYKLPFFVRKFVIAEINGCIEFDKIIHLIDCNMKNTDIKFQLKEYDSLSWRESTRQEWLDYNANWLNIKEKFYKKK